MQIRTKQLWVMAVMSLTGAGWTATAGSTAPSSDIPKTLSPSAGQSVVVNKVSTPFVGMAGSQENAVALANALRTGTTANLTFTSRSSTGELMQVTTPVAVPTKPMGWGNVSHALALAQVSLRQAGIENPTAADLQAALDGGYVTTADGKSVALAGVLRQRAQGMGWGQIAKSYGTTMGAVNHGVKARMTTVASSGSTRAAASAAARSKVATSTTHGHAAKETTKVSTALSNNLTPAPGSRGLTRASRALANSGANGHAATGISTAMNATASASPGVVTAAANGHGQGNALGRGVVTAGGSGSNANVLSRGNSAGVVTGSGNAARSSTPTGWSGHAGGHGKHSG